ncbi:uncharacterized protein [Watersipora subatra]|uniref:uncharacterized protein n=1 Tax=Watersipora subatra TaxID=2589382 RepID=UPI00355B6D57
MATRLVEGLNNHKKLEKFSYKKYKQRSPVGQLQVIHNVESAGTFLSVRPSATADILKLNHNALNSIDLQSQETPDNNPRLLQRNKSAPIWVRVPSHTEMWEACALQDKAKTRKIVFSHSKSITGREKIGSKSASTKKTGKALTRPQTNATLYRFRPIDIKAAYSKENIQLCTALIREQWDSKERQYISSGAYARGKSEAKDKALQQWLTFEGDSPGALSAFTPGEERSSPEENPRFSIEAGVGIDVAAKLVLGEKVRIGQNGKLLLGQEFDDADDNSVFYDKCDSLLNMTHSIAQKHEPLNPPLCWQDVESKAKVIVPKAINEFNSRQQMNKTTPVIYHSSPNIKPYVPLSAQSDKGRLTMLLSHKLATARRRHEDQAEMTYEEILESHTPHSSRKNKSAGLAAPTPDNTTAQPSTLNKSPKKMTAKLPPQVLSVGHYDFPYIKRMFSHNPVYEYAAKNYKLLTASRRTPNILEEVKSGIQRQVTMPSYNVVSEKPVERVAGRPKTSQSLTDRAATPIRPPKYVPSYNSGNGTTPSISHNGMEGEKTFVQITTPINHLFRKELTDQAVVKEIKEQSATTSIPYKEHRTRTNNTPVGLATVTLVGKAPPIEKQQKTNVKVNHQQVAGREDKETYETAPELSATESSLGDLANLPNRLAINIPAVDMISASSAANNSIADFQEFDNASHKANPLENAARRVADVNNNNSIQFSADTESAQSDQSLCIAPSIASFENETEEFSISVDVTSSAVPVL